MNYGILEEISKKPVVLENMSQNVENKEVFAVLSSVDGLEIMRKVQNIAIDKKAIDVKLLHIGPLTSIAEFFLICHTTSSRHAKAISDEISLSLKNDGIRPIGIEGDGASDWILLDYGDFMVHIFSENARSYYNLEQLWCDAEEIITPK